MVYRSFFLLLVFVFSLYLINGCRHETTSLDFFEPVCFDTEIQPVFTQSCATSGCHDAATAAAGYVLDNYNNIFSKGIEPGNALNSEIYLSLVSGDDLMPPDAPLDQETRTKIRVWIEQGAKQQICRTEGGWPAPKDTLGNILDNDSACFNTTIFPVLISSCGISGCHSEADVGNTLALESYEGLMANDEYIIPGDLEKSKVYKSITEDSPEERMPQAPHPALSQEQIDGFAKWISDGALNSICESNTCDTTMITFTNHVWPLVKSACTGCHSGDNPEAGLLLLNYSDVSGIAGNGMLADVISRSGTSVPMPPDHALNPCNVRQIEIWIENGAADN